MAAGTKPFWGEPNSSVNWCENDYVFSQYIAEFWNSLSSLCMAAFGYYGRVTMPKSSNINLNRIWWTWFMLEIVGWGSVAFHGTLKWWSQALDEVPMVRIAIQAYEIYIMILTQE